MDDSKLKQITEEYELSTAVPEKLPGSTFWPITLALGVIFFFWGFITSLILSGVGLVAIGFAVAGWIGDMNNE
jgi:hypothetical protein